MMIIQRLLFWPKDGKIFGYGIALAMLLVQLRVPTAKPITPILEQKDVQGPITPAPVQPVVCSLPGIRPMPLVVQNLGGQRR